MAAPLRHRQTKEAATDMFSLPPPRHISTLHQADLSSCQLFCPLFGGEADTRGSRCLLWSAANDPSATSTGLKFRSVAVACAISFVPKRGKALSSQTAHGHQAPRPSVFAQDDGRRTEPATTELRRMVPRVGARPNAA